MSALMGITFAAVVLPQVSVALEAFTGARSACYPALVAMNRRTDGNFEKDSVATSTPSDNVQRRGSVALPKYVIDSSSDAGEKPSSVTGELEFKNVTFAYPTRQEVNIFEGLSLKIEAGKTVALVGPR
jgi:ABC-type multidrug transport system fused ATPase/permease subunit